MFEGAGGWYFGMHFLWWIVWILIIGAAFATITPVPKHLTRSGERALDILRRRYAAGQVSDVEYERRKAVLERDEPGGDSVAPRG